MCDASERFPGCVIVASSVATLCVLGLSRGGEANSSDSGICLFGRAFIDRLHCVFDGAQEGLVGGVVAANVVVNFVVFDGSMEESVSDVEQQVVDDCWCDVYESDAGPIRVSGSELLVFDGPFAEIRVEI